MNSNIHRVKNITVEVDTKNKWSTIKITDSDGTKNEITLFAYKDDMDNLAIKTIFTGV